MKDFIIKRKFAVILTCILLIVGTTLYFTLGAYNLGEMSIKSAATIEELNVLRNVQLKAAYTEEGSIDMFVLARNNDLSKIKPLQGNSIPEIGGMVIGNVEGSMMQEENEFKNIGDTLVDYDITFRIDGILDKTGTFMDDFHFISSEEYTKLSGEENVLFVKFKDAKTPKLFYLYDKNNPSPAKISLSEGNINFYYKHIIGKKIYYPIIIGYEEAKMMREEKLFNKVGDTLEGFFDRDVMIVGITQKTDTGLDMMHVVEKDFFDESLRGTLV
jgi:hypothetical protein